MIFLDADEHYFITETRRELVAALIERLPAEPCDETLAMLAPICLGLEAIIGEVLIK